MTNVNISTGYERHLERNRRSGGTRRFLQRRHSLDCSRRSPAPVVAGLQETEGHHQRHDQKVLRLRQRTPRGKNSFLVAQMTFLLHLLCHDGHFLRLLNGHPEKSPNEKSPTKEKPYKSSKIALRVVLTVHRCHTVGHREHNSGQSDLVRLEKVSKLISLALFSRRRYKCLDIKIAFGLKISPL